MITFTSNDNCLNGRVISDGPRVRYEYKPEPSKLFACLVGMTALVLFILVLFALFGTLFEDGSFIWGPVRGCLPFSLCN